MDQLHEAAVTSSQKVLQWFQSLPGVVVKGGILSSVIATVCYWGLPSSCSCQGDDNKEATLLPALLWLVSATGLMWFSLFTHQKAYEEGHKETKNKEA